MGHSNYTFDAGHGRTFSADCCSVMGLNDVSLRTDGSSAHLLLSDAQLEQLHDVIQQRLIQIIAQRTNAAQASKGCVCPEYAGESAGCPVHGLTSAEVTG